MSLERQRAVGRAPMVVTTHHSLGSPRAGEESPRRQRGFLTMLAALAAIPSPGNGSIEIGPLTFRAYGFMIALGVLAAVWLVARRFGQRGLNPDHATGLAMWAVPAGLVGARLYHVITDWRSFEGRWGDAFKIWEGGLGILGGVIAGAFAGYAYMRRHNIEPGMGFDVVAPALPLRWNCNRQP